MQAFDRRLDIAKAALNMAPFAQDDAVGCAVFGDARPIDVQHSEILHDCQRAIEKRTGPRNADANHPDNHAGSPGRPSVCAMAQRANSSTWRSESRAIAASACRWAASIASSASA